MNIKMGVYDCLDLANLIMIQRGYDYETQKAALKNYWKLINDFGWSRLAAAMCALEHDIRAENLVVWFSDDENIRALERECGNW